MYPASKRPLFCCGEKQMIKHFNFSYDALTIYDGSSNTSPMIGKYCGDLLPSSQISSTNKVLIHFETDWATTRKGFKLEYHTNSKRYISIAQFICHFQDFRISAFQGFSIFWPITVFVVDYFQNKFLKISHNKQRDWSKKCWNPEMLKS